MNIQNILKAAFFTPGVYGRWGLPLLITGIPGGGKTATITDATTRCGMTSETLLASLREPTEFGGFPFISGTGDNMTIKLAAMPWVERAVAAKHAVVNCDEINTAPESVFAALLRVILEGVVGDVKLPSTVRFVACMNPPECSAGGRDIPAPLANRFGHLRFDNPDANLWANWLLAGNEHMGEAMNPAAEEARVMALWPSAYAKSRGLVAGFIRTRPQLLHKMPQAFDPKASLAWPSPRTWEMAARSRAGAEIHGLDATDSEVLFEAFVGEGAASEFLTYVSKMDLPDPADVLDGKVQFTHEPTRLDRTVAVLDSCAALVSSPAAAKRAARADNLWKLLGEVAKQAIDLTVPCGVTLVKSKLLTPASKPVLRELQPILAAAGITGA